MSLSPEIVAALVEHKGKIGEILSVIEAIERGNFGVALFSGLSHEAINRISMDAYQWTERFKEMVTSIN
jgi:c-di-GMP-related signal transduction protein